MSFVSLADSFSSSPVARYWKDPHKFMPERFLGDYPKEAFISFAQGPYLLRFTRHCKSRPRTLCRFPCLHRETVSCHGEDESQSVYIPPSRFSETEAIAVLNSIVSRYRFEVKEEPEFAGETFKERYARVTAFEQFITTRYVIHV